ncbi:MAG: ABC-2 family transporter protein [Lachnospiraceae bacterium]|nr:ABC-2 family transporter protein [Lachnospiraceae bacterium]
MSNIKARGIGFINTYKAFTKAGVQSSMAYRASFLCFVLGESLYCFVMYFIWKAVFSSSGNSTFMGFSMTDMTVYVFLSNLVGFLTSTDSTENLADEIHDGSIIMRMIKPVNVDFSLLAFELGNKVMMITCVFLPVMIGVEIYRFTVLGYCAFHIGNFLLFVVSTVISYLLAFYLNLIFGYLAFFLMNIWGFSILKGSLIKFFSGSLIPLAFFPGAVRVVFEQLPFASLVYVPTMLYMGKYSGWEIVFVLAKQILWLGVFIYISKVIWKWAQKRLAVQGG